MRLKLLISTGAVIGLLAVSVMAANSNSPDEQREAVPTVEETASVKETVAPMEKTPEPTTEPKKTEAPVEQSLVYSRDWDSEESYMLAKIAMAEAEDEDTEGKALVICVVLNRVWSEGHFILKARVHPHGIGII